MNDYEDIKAALQAGPASWLVTGAAGFIGSSLLEALLEMDQVVVGLDNFATGHQRNLDEVRSRVTALQWRRFTFIEGDIRDPAVCRQAVGGIDHVLHQAALGSVPRSVDDPVTTNQVNVGGFLNMLVAARDAKVRSFTYAASSSTYGDHPDLPRVEDNIGHPLSPYAVTKYVDELYAGVFARNYGFRSVGLRYFNVFGPRQDPEGAYAAVIPGWVAAMLRGDEVRINGDGETSRDFCFVENVVQANILAATCADTHRDQVYNIACGASTTLNELFELIRARLADLGVKYDRPPVYGEFRIGDVRHSMADISKAITSLGYKPLYGVSDGLAMAMPWYRDVLSSANSRRPG